MIKLLKFFNFIIKNKTSFTIKKPVTNKFLLFDNMHLNLLNNYIEKKNIEILNVRLESLNLFVILNIILKFKFRYIDYLAQYIILVNPKFVITFIDNKTLFYLLKDKVKKKNIFFISIQNGIRRKKNDIFEILEKNKNLNLKCDYYFCYGNAIKNELSKYIKSKYIINGSFLNNLIPIERNTKKNNYMCFISNYRYHTHVRNNKINKKNNYLIEYILLPYLAEYCLKHETKLYILASTNFNYDPQLREEIYYKNILKDYFNWKFIIKKNTENYKYLDNSKINIFIDSTLGYESFARKNKTLAVSLRLLGKESSWKFAWPKDDDFRNDVFNLTSLSKEQLFIKISNIINLDNDEFEKISMKLNQIISYSKNNKEFEKIISI